MATYKERITNILDTISALFEEYEMFQSEKAMALIEEFQTSTETLITDLDSAQELFYNDPNLDGILGQGINFLRGDGYCSCIGKEYEYPSVRDLVWANLNPYVNETNILSPLDEYLTDILDTWEKFDKYYTEVFKPLHPDEPSEVDPETEEETKEEVTTYDQFWDLYYDEKLPKSSLPDFADWDWDGEGVTIKNKVADKLEMITAIFSKLDEAAITYKDLIQAWLDLGSEIMQALSIAYHLVNDKIEINDDKREIDTVEKNLPEVNMFSPRVGEMYGVAKPIRDKYGDLPPTKINLVQPEVDMDNIKPSTDFKFPPQKIHNYDRTKIAVFEELKVKERSTEIYEKMKKNFDIIKGVDENAGSS